MFRYNYLEKSLDLMIYRLSNHGWWPCR